MKLEGGREGVWGYGAMGKRVRSRGLRGNACLKCCLNDSESVKDETIRFWEL